MKEEAKTRDENEILRELVVSKEDIIKNLVELVKKTKNVFVIEDKTGKIIFKNFSDLKNHEKICGLLIGKHFAKKLGFIDDECMTGSQISNEIKIPQTTLAAPLKKVVDKGYVLKDETRYYINYHRLEEIIDDILSDLNGN